MNQEILSLRRDSVDLNSVLLRGELLKHGESWKALPRETVASSSGVESIVFELIRPEGLSKPPFYKILWRAIRPENLTVTATPGLSVLLLGWSKGWEASWWVGGLALLGALFFQISVNLLNDVEDHMRLIDLPGSLGGSGVIQRGWMSAIEMRNLGYLALVAGMLAGFPAILASPQILWLVGLCAGVGVISYSNRPFGVKYRVLGDLTVFGLMGPLLTIGLSQSFFLQWDASVLVLGIFFGFTAWGISHAHNLGGMDTEHSNPSIHTLATLLGYQNSRHLWFFIYLCSYLTLGVGIVFGILPKILILSLLIAAPFAVLSIRRVYQASGPVSALMGQVRNDAAKLHFVLGLAVSLGILMSLLKV